MQIHTYSSRTVAQNTADETVIKLIPYLHQGKTLLFVSGGSIAMEVCLELKKALEAIPPNYFSQLTVALCDERFGRPYHQHSNAYILKELGFLTYIEIKGATFIEPLQKGEKDVYAAARIYEDRLLPLLQETDGRQIAIVGIGADCHTVGIKPMKSKAAFKELFDNQVVVGYKGQDFERITITPQVILNTAELIVYARGSKKKGALQKILTESIDKAHLYPAVVLKNHLHAHLFTDQKI